MLSLADPGIRCWIRYMGVGSTVVGALKHGRIGIGCDTEKSYVDVAWDRVRQLQAGVLKTRPMDRPVYDPAKPFSKAVRGQELTA